MTQHTKGDLRRLRKEARAQGKPLTGDLALPEKVRSPRYTCRCETCAPHGQPAQEFTETARGYRARERWARRYDALNGAPEGDWDR